MKGVAVHLTPLIKEVWGLKKHNKTSWYGLSREFDLELVLYPPPPGFFFNHYVMNLEKLPSDTKLLRKEFPENYFS